MQVTQDVSTPKHGRKEHVTMNEVMRLCMVYVSISSTKETINTHRHNLFSPRNTVNSTVTRRTDFFFSILRETSLFHLRKILKQGLGFRNPWPETVSEGEFEAKS